MSEPEVKTALMLVETWRDRLVASLAAGTAEEGDKQLLFELSVFLDNPHFCAMLGTFQLAKEGLGPKSRIIPPCS